MGFLDFTGLSHFLDKIKTITIPSSSKGAANGVAELDANGKVPSSQLPSYVDDVLNYDDVNYANWPEWESGASYSVGDNVKVTASEDPAAVTGYICIVANSSASILNTEWREATKFPAQGESGIIYIADVTNITYRWGGSSYVAIGSDLALGETSSTAYRGDRGKIAYDHANDSGRITTAQASGLYKVATTSEGHIASVTAVQKSDITNLGIPAQDTTYESKTESQSGTDVSLVTTGEKYNWNHVLPAVSSSDNGKALMVSSGTWVAGTLPDEVLEYASQSSFPASGSAGKIYIAKDTNEIFRWDTTENEYVIISSTNNEPVLYPVSFSIATTDWTSTTGGYNYTVTSQHITTDTEELITYDSSLGNVVGGIDSSKSSGNRVFFVTEIPTGPVSGTIYVFNGTRMEIDGKVDIAQGIANEGKVLVVNSSGNLVPGNNILRYSDKTAFPVTGNANYMYIANDETQAYVWDGEAYHSVKGGKPYPVVTAPTPKSNLTYTGSPQALIDAGSTTGGTLQYSLNGIDFSTSIPTGTNAGTYSVYYRVEGNDSFDSVSSKSVTVTIGKAQGTLSLNKSSMTFTAASQTDYAIVTATIPDTIQLGKSYVSVTSSDNSVATGAWEFDFSTGTRQLKINVTSITGGDAIITVTLLENDNYLGGASATISVAVNIPKVYGVSSSGTNSPVWSRTDDAANFSDPVPYVIDASSYSSPFDNILPWSGMTVVEDNDAGELVQIPKFYYKLEKNSGIISIKISTAALEGYSVSPAHMARNSSDHERDVVYVGRYHCSSTDYKSRYGDLPKANITRTTFRTNIHALGEDIWQWDWAMMFTVWLLYLVEFANWNSQAKIGYGCNYYTSGASSEGIDKSMDFYHTATDQNSREQYGKIRYRNIEGLWNNVYTFVDGCYNNSNGLNIILDPTKFSESSNGTLIDQPYYSGNWFYPVSFTVYTRSGLFPMFMADYISTSGYSSYYSCDQWAYSSSASSIFTGGSYQYKDLAYGLFFISGASSSWTSNYAGSRLMKLP